MGFDIFFCLGHESSNFIQLQSYKKCQFLKQQSVLITKLYVYCHPFLGLESPIISIAAVMELVDMLDLGSSAARRGGSTPFSRTKPRTNSGFFYVFLSYSWQTGTEKISYCCHILKDSGRIINPKPVLITQEKYQSSLVSRSNIFRIL